MKALAEPQVAPDLQLDDAEFTRVAKIAHARFGLNLTTSKKPLVQSRLIKRMHVIGVQDFSTYIDLCTNTGSEEERHLLSCLTTNVTHFFREKHHFDILTDVALPDLLERARSGGRVRLWSAACSSGQEAYCIAAALLDRAPDIAQYDVKILATDIDSDILIRAEQGRYPEVETYGLPPDLRNRFFDDGPDQTVIAGEKLRSLISFGQLNLVADWPINGPFDVIFCRNVAIYFDKPTQIRLWERFRSILASGGYLMIGHSERIDRAASLDFESVGVTAYRKTPPPPT